ncbi:O-acetylhomoserine aminocarboxypropyltransferase/cysteine synthase family protein [Kocuria sp. NPDC057446]|uniref:O-acetylhomoserine aminocarboxypropyltransferase/cysteine synthase family protein n=1 Tax=Kocuria sp. NPDC057446 TaxID=3346137 RepID=UPI0036C8EB22
MSIPVTDHDLATRQIHAGTSDPVVQRTLTVPIYQTAAFEFPDYEAARQMFAQTRAGFTYTRTGNPTVAVLEQRISDLEGGTGAVATGSGQSAVAVALLALLGQGAGKHLVASEKLYGGTVDLLTDSFADCGIEVSFVDPTAPGAWAAAVRPDTRAFLLESIGNPLATLPDLPGIADVARAAGVPVVVDNTLASPALYRPLEKGADIVVHSATKFLGGHGNALAGAVVDGGTFDWSARPGKWPQFTRARARWGGQSLVEKCAAASPYLHLVRAKYVHDLGTTLSPFNAAQILQGTETLDLRVSRHTASALTVAEFLTGHPAVARVHHPGVPGDPGAGIAARDFPRGTGSVFSFDLAAPDDAVGPFIDALRLFKLVANVGDTRSLVAHPAAMTHCRLTPEQRRAGGIAETTIRLSIGLESPQDLVADLGRALDTVATTVQTSRK